MKKRIYYWILLILLGLSVALIYVLNPWSTTGKGIETFIPENPEAVREIYLFTAYDTLIFNQKDEDWYMGEEMLDRKPVDNLLYAASGLSLKSIVPFGALKSLDMGGEVVFNSRKKELGRFTFASGNKEFYIFNKESIEIYGVELRGHEDYSLERIFSINADHYRKHLLLDLLPDEIKLISVHPLNGKPFLARQDSSYHITVEDLDKQQDITGLIDKEKIRLLFSYFNTIRYNKVIGQQEIEPATQPSEPIAELSVKSFSEDTWNFKIYPLTMRGQSSPDIFKALVIFNNKPDYLSIDYFYLDLLIRGEEKYRIN